MSQVPQLIYVLPFVTGKTLNVQNLSRVLVQVTNWHLLGIRLGVPSHKLKTIEQNYPIDTERCKNEMLTMWLQMFPNARWRDIVRALHEMDYHAPAKKVYREYVRARPRFAARQLHWWHHVLLLVKCLSTNISYKGKNHKHKLQEVLGKCYMHGVRECAYQSLLKWKNESCDIQKTTVKH